MVVVSRFPEKEGGRPAHGIDSPHNEGESPSLEGRFFLVHRHLPGKYHSVSNVPAILLGRVDLRVDRKQFRNHIKIQDYLSAVIHVSHSRIGTGRHGGRPSQEPDANPPPIYTFPANRR